MPNGKGSTNWGWKPSFEELVVALIVFAVTLGISKHIFLAITTGLVIGFTLLWANNGWPGIRK